MRVEFAIIIGPEGQFCRGVGVGRNSNSSVIAFVEAAAVSALLGLKIQNKIVYHMHSMRRPGTRF